jgi:Fur family iron response transcriptional regulator
MIAVKFCIPFQRQPDTMADRSLSPKSIPSRRPCLTAVLRMAGLRPTRQRVALAELLFAGEHRHVSAEQLHAEASAARVNVSLATIYNSLHQFREAGLLREVAVDAARSYFDTDTSDHHHFYLEDEQRVIDIPSSSIVIQNLPEPPKGTAITHVDVVVRVRRSE